MKKTTIKIAFIIALALPTVVMASQSGGQARETVGLYGSQVSREAAQESHEKVGLYKDLKDFEDLKDFKEDPDDSGDLRAGDTMGGGGANKVPLREDLPLLLLGVVCYATFLLFSLFLTQKKKKKFLKCS